MMFESSKEKFSNSALPEKPKIYLAGPDVFYPNAKKIGQIHKMMCTLNNATGLFPLDNEVDTSLSVQEQARQIVQGNIRLIEQADIVLANLTNFRGTATHLCCDSGTAWECGFGVALKKIVIGYTYTPGSVPQEIVDNIHVLFNLSENENLFSVFALLTNVVIRNITATPPEDNIRKYNLDPPYADIHDADPVTSFYLGMRKGLGNKCTATLSDKRSLIEKYGTVDENGNSVENFECAVNIMMAVTTDIK